MTGRAEAFPRGIVHGWLGIWVWLFLNAAPAWAQTAPLQVVLDDNYPPYVFRDDQGKPQGILVDLWRLWEYQTGRRVEIHVMDWGEALRRMRAGEFDVIDTIFFTKERANYFDFSKPYTRIEVPIFFRKEISGIKDLASLKGFPVAAKQGDAAEELLRQNGVTTELPFNSYQSIVEAAKEGKVNVFIIDRPPALYFLHKLGIQDQFRQSAAVNVGEFHRAVRKGNTALLKTVEAGFAAIPKNDRDEIEQRWFGRLLNGRSFLPQLRYTAIGGSFLVVVLAVFSLRIRAQRHRAEAALRESQRRFDTLAENSTLGVFRTNQAGQTTYVNRRWSEITGLSAQEALGEGWLRAVHPADREAVLNGWKQAQADARASLTDYRFQRPDGTVVWVIGQATPERDATGGVTGYIGTITDISQRKQAEEDLLRQAALLDAATDAIYVRDLNHVVTYWNRGAERLYGWPRAEALGRTMAGLGIINPTAFDPAQAELLEKGQWTGELRKRTKTGAEIDVFCRWTLLRDPQGRPAEVLAINTDVTEKKRLEAQFFRAQRMENIGALAGGIAHDLNNLLSPVLMIAPMLRETIQDPERRELLDTVENCARRGADIIRQLLTFARGAPGARVPLPVRHLLLETDKILRETFPRNILLRIGTGENLWPVLGDTTQIHQALMNLCVNARDAMPAGGTLTLRAENVRLDETVAAATPNGRPGTFVRITVADTGVGIPPENLERIFDPFFTTKELGKGTGLGLPTVLGIVRGHDGFMQVESQVGKGTTFQIHLPATPKTPAPTAVENGGQLPQGHGELILVVDDEVSIRESVRRTLEKHNYRVMTAAEGSEALAMFNEHAASVRAVLTDMMMPGMDGLTLAQALGRRQPHLLILAMTGLAERSETKGLDSPLLSAVLTKPFPPGELLRELARVIASQGCIKPPQA